jgi:hypothetical protein
MSESSTPQFIDPIDPQRYNVFAIDDYLRTIANPAARERLIHDHGLDPEVMSRYEDENDLPRGAFELAVMLSDLRVQQMTDEMTKLTLASVDKPELKVELAQKDFTMRRGLIALYPRAMHFLTQYEGKLAAGSGRSVLFSQAYYEEDLCSPTFCVFVIAFVVLLVNVAKTVNYAANYNYQVNLNCSLNANFGSACDVNAQASASASAAASASATAAGAE